VKCIGFQSTHACLVTLFCSVYRVLVGKPEGKRPMGKPRRRWEDNIKIDLQEVGWGVWIESSWLRIGTGGGHL
jgi:hypothetical protein